MSRDEPILPSQGCGAAGAQAAGVSVPAGTDLLFGETTEDHAFVQEEQMMPFLPVVRVRHIDAARAIWTMPPKWRAP